MVGKENLKNVKYHTSWKKQLFLLFPVSVTMNRKKIFKEEASIEILKILRLTENI